jgi:hypothetical protein
MPFAPQPIIEQPNLRSPIALIVDDPAPCINSLWYFRNQVDKQDTPAHEQTIPLDFMQAWCNFVRGQGLSGDFTVLPFPAGLGRIDNELRGYDTGELREWLALAREYVAPQFDIHCEILTHTMALNLHTWLLMTASEHEWTMSQNEATLTDYFATAMQILGEAGLPNHGVTQPCYYHGDESLYARAVLAAEKRVNGRKVTHNFLHMDGVSDYVPPRITHLDESAGEAVVSVWTGIDDFIWNAQERGSKESEMRPEELAGRYVTADGQSGRLATLLNGGGPIVLVTHWQSLYSNGSRLGLRTYQEVADRVQSLWGDRVMWSKLSEISSRYLAARCAQVTSEATPNKVAVSVESPFATDLFTLSIPTPWPLYTGPTLTIDGEPAEQVMSAKELSVGKWLMRGSVVTVSLPLVAGDSSEITITAKPA